jgi:hypothetical protein
MRSMNVYEKNDGLPTLLQGIRNKRSLLIQVYLIYILHLRRHVILMQILL